MMVSHTQRKPYLISLKISYLSLKKQYLPHKKWHLLLNKTLLYHQRKKRFLNLWLRTQATKMKSLRTHQMPKRVKRLKSSQATKLIRVHQSLRESLRTRKKKQKFFLLQFSKKTHLHKRMTKAKKKRRLLHRLEMGMEQGSRLCLKKST